VPDFARAARWDAPTVARQLAAGTGIRLANEGS
jgi:hypothetical protein